MPWPATQPQSSITKTQVRGTPLLHKIYNETRFMVLLRTITRDCQGTYLGFSRILLSFECYKKQIQLKCYVSQTILNLTQLMSPHKLIHLYPHTNKINLFTPPSSTYARKFAHLYSLHYVRLIPSYNRVMPTKHTLSISNPKMVFFSSFTVILSCSVLTF